MFYKCNKFILHSHPTTLHSFFQNKGRSRNFWNFTGSFSLFWNSKIILFIFSVLSRTCVNGQVVSERTQLRHGDRILWGNNHFFRINCPHSAPAQGNIKVWFMIWILVSKAFYFRLGVISMNGDGYFFTDIFTNYRFWLECKQYSFFNLLIYYTIITVMLLFWISWLFLFSIK